jgi:two-component system, NtrC family, sensor kinase
MILKKHYDKFLRFPLRAKFTITFLFVICFGGVITLFFGTRIEHNTIFSLAQAKVRHDLASARMVYNEKLFDIRDIVRLNSVRESIQNALKNKQRESLFKHLEPVRTEFNLDFLTMTDAEGKVFLRTSNPEIWGDSQSDDPLVKNALFGRTAAATQIINRDELLKEGNGLAEKAYIEFIPTQKAAPREKDHEENALALKAAAPVRDENNVLLGVLYAGVILNRNYEIVDKVKEIVFKGEKYKGREIGTVTIFQHDLRISTNVENKNGQRAIGTRVSREVNRAVLREGKDWIDRAFVVNNWYITAYEPILNMEGDIIGILYVGMLEKPYIDLRNRVMGIFTGIAALCVLLLLAILYAITSTIINPLNKLVAATNKIAKGDLSHKVNINLKDEIGQLAHSFNMMTDDLNKANQKLIQWGKTLEKQVEERTKKIKEMQDSLIQSEKLASLGKMAAGIAHEINNPLTSILINSHLLLEKPNDDPYTKESLNLITEETSRCSSIVKGLLEFSRQSPPKKEPADINRLIANTSTLLENQFKFQNIEVKKDFDPNLPNVKIDTGKIKQVLWNLMINAAEAMPDGGKLTIATSLSEKQKHIVIKITDTGKGIPKDNINKLFDPFFTTKESGSGLGLAVTYGIIQQHQGSIKANSKVGQGTTFTVVLPISSNLNNS